MRLVAALVFLFSSAAQGQWKVVDETPAQDPESPLLYERKAVSRKGESGFFTSRRIDLVWFNAKTHTFRVIDNGGSDKAIFPDLITAMRKNGCLAGCNGGFFLENDAPSGLMISSGNETGKFGSANLLSGVLLSSGNRNPYLLRRAEYGPAYQPTDLIQAGPFLVDGGVTVRGLSPENSRRRTFVVHDGGDWFAIGLSDALTLAHLGEVIAHAEFSPNRKIHRALNLDGGTSSGFFFDRGSEAAPLHVEPFKKVRNFVGIVPKQ
ncbi:MAG: phosphodiester glycosidase family protein [Verrucomicrobiota bacterium]